MATKKFPSECNPRGVVKTADKVLIWNSDTGASDEWSTVAQLTKIQDDAITDLDNTKEEKVAGKGLSTNDYDNTEKAAVANSVRKSGGTMTGGIISVAVVNPLTTAAESWIGPSATGGVCFKGGNVGIGTTTPGVNKLSISTTGDANAFNLVNATGNLLLGTTTDVTSYGGAKLQVKSSGNTATTWYGRIIAGGDSKVFVMGQIDGKAVLGGHLAGLTNWADMYINPDVVANTYIGNTLSYAPNTLSATVLSVLGTGNVGIGTANPRGKLEISKAGHESLTFYPGYTSNINLFEGYNRVGGVYTSLRNDFADYRFNIGSTEKVRIDTNGNVGVETTVPNYKLELGSDSAGKPGAGGLWTVVSDARIKKDIELADLDICYETIKNIPLKRYAWADGVYSEQQVKDRHNLGWIAQDVQKYFSKAVSIIPFTKNEKIEDGVEEYQEQDFIMEDKETTTIEVIDGQPTQVRKTTQEKTMLFDELEVKDENGNIVIQDGKPELFKIPRMVTKTRPKFRQETIDDCLDLNSGQLYAAMYGALQKTIQKIEVLEKEIALLKL